MVSFIAILAGLLAHPAHALPLKANMNVTKLPSAFTANYDFTGIVALDDCSGSLIQLEGAPNTDYALVLTNGHCLETGMPDPNTFVYQQPSSRQFDLLDANAQAIGSLNASEIIYSTMTNTDITIYQLTQTYAQIEQQYNIHPLILSSKHPNLQDPIEVISGYWQRGYSCHIDAFVHELKEASWTWEDSIRYSNPGCEVIGGTSGSPVVLAGTRTVIGINNTGNENGEKCTLDNPCEVDANGNIHYQQGLSYGEETYWIYSCVNANHQFDLSVPGCQLYH